MEGYIITLCIFENTHCLNLTTNVLSHNPTFAGTFAGHKISLVVSVATSITLVTKTNLKKFSLARN